MKTRTLLIPLAVMIAWSIPAAQALLQFGLSAAEFSHQGDTTLRVAGYAFAIWGLLYLGMLIYAIYQALPGTQTSLVLSKLAWPSIIAIAGCGLWIAAAAMNLAWGTVTIISLSALALATALLKIPADSNRADYWCAVVPMSLLAGWLTIATAANILTVLTMKGMILPAAVTPAGLLGIVVTSVVAAAVAARAGNAPYLLPIVWGLGGIYVAERDRNPTLAATALGAAALLMVAAAIIAVHRQRSGQRIHG